MLVTASFIAACKYLHRGLFMYGQIKLYCDPVKKSHQDSWMSSFHVRVCHEDYEKLKAPEIWPVGWKCRDFIRRKPFRPGGQGQPLGVQGGQVQLLGGQGGQQGQQIGIQGVHGQPLGVQDGQGQLLGVQGGQGQPLGVQGQSPGVQGHRTLQDPAVFNVGGLQGIRPTNNNNGQ